MAGTDRRDILRDIQQTRSQPPKRRGLAFQPVDLGVNSRRHCLLGGIPAESPKFLFQMLFGLTGDIPDASFLLQADDKFCGRGHSLAMPQTAYVPVLTSGSLPWAIDRTARDHDGLFQFLGDPPAWPEL